ncbi:MAG: DNA polymerase III subunit delta [Lachnospiraceae bacterium]|jgi:DNA polymerase-3 subunit delta'|nr:DNA polymerase III subunit delta [Lachnospiraceae bacterium]
MTGFDGIVGHEMVKGHLLHAIGQKRVSHAYIISGEAGCGKKTIADAFVLGLFCERGSEGPCLRCGACKRLLTGNHPDCIRVTHEKPDSVGVDDIRVQVQDTIQIRPYSADYKVYIIDEAHKMTVQAQNALLKTIEEPPPYGVLLLLSENPDAFLPTVLSRCVQLTLRPLPDDMVKGYLLGRLGAKEAEAATVTAFAMGNIGKAIKLCSSEEFRKMYDELVGLLKEALMPWTGSDPRGWGNTAKPGQSRKADIFEMAARIERLKESGADVQECLDFIRMWLRDLLVYKTTGDAGILTFRREADSIREIGAGRSFEELWKGAGAVDEAQSRIKSNVNAQLALECMMSELVGATAS